MAFDAGFLHAILHEIRTVAQGARIEKVMQPQKDEIVLQMRTFDGPKRLLINAGSSDPRLGFTELVLENPAQPPMLCMLLRKHLTGSELVEIKQFDFERACEFVFSTRDEMGFPCRKSLIVEIMGKYSNLIFADEAHKIIAALHVVDFTTSSLRQVLPGMTYELPPAQDRLNPLTVTAEQCLELLATASPEAHADKWILSTFLGIAPSVAREIVYRSSGEPSTLMADVDPRKLAQNFAAVFQALQHGELTPCYVTEGRKPVEYAFLELTQYAHVGEEITVTRTPTCCQALDFFFTTRERVAHVKQSASDIIHILNRAETRLTKKLQLQHAELEDCKQGESYKRMGDLITNNIFLLKIGMTEAKLTDYEDYHEDTNTYGEVSVTLDGKLSPASNAQRYYKKYNKCCNAERALTEQIALGESELTYIRSVADALSRAETSADLTQIRAELTAVGYVSVGKKQMARKLPSNEPLKYRSPSGLLILCGKNNLQNDQLTFKTANRFDYWFHVKNAPGSHVILFTDEHDPTDEDFTAAAEIAAFNSKLSDGQNVPVDYTEVRNIHKPPAAKPGFVIFHTNWTAYVTPDPSRIDKYHD